MLDLEQVANLVEVVGPARVWPVSAKKCLGVAPRPRVTGSMWATALPRHVIV